MPKMMILALGGEVLEGMSFLFRFQAPNHARRVARHHGKRRHIFGDNGSSPHDRAFPDGYAWQDAGLETDPNIALQANGAGGHLRRGHAHRAKGDALKLLSPAKGVERSAVGTHHNTLPRT